MPSRIGDAADRKVGSGERLAADLGTRLHRIEGAEHFGSEDHPGLIAQVINRLPPVPVVGAK